VQYSPFILTLRQVIKKQNKNNMFLFMFYSIN